MKRMSTIDNAECELKAIVENLLDSNSKMKIPDLEKKVRSIIPEAPIGLICKYRYFYLREKW